MAKQTKNCAVRSFWKTLLTSSDVAFSQVSNWPAVSPEGAEVILGISFTLRRYKCHHRGGHVGMHVRDVDVVINNGAKLGFTSNSYVFIYAV